MDVKLCFFSNISILKMPRRRIQGGKGIKYLEIFSDEWKIIQPRRIIQSAEFFISYESQIEELLIVKPEHVLISAFYVTFRKGEKFNLQVVESKQLGNYIIWH